MQKTIDTTKEGFDILISVNNQLNIEIAAKKIGISPSELVTLAVIQKVKKTLPIPIPEDPGKKLESFNIVFSEKDEKDIKTAAELKNQSISDFIVSAISWEMSLIRSPDVYNNIRKNMNIADFQKSI